MPFKNEKANKFSHEKIINSQIIENKINEYQITFDVGNTWELENRFINYKSTKINKINFIFTVDSSYTELPINDDIPSAKFGIVNFSFSLVNLGKKSEVYDTGFIDPQKFNDLYNSNIFTFVCPTFNLVPKNNKEVGIIDSIRNEIFSFYTENAPFNSISLIDTLYNVIKGTTDKITLKCTNVECNINSVFNLDEIGVEPFECPNCNNNLYLTDYLRLHEAIDEEFGHSTILTRFAQITEHLTSINLIDSLMKIKSYDLISKIAFIIDGPLAIFGEAAKMHKGLLKYLHDVSKKIGEDIVFFGILKSGRLKDHFYLLEKKINLSKNSFLLVDDNYRFSYIQKAPKVNKYFGQEVLYGQDFLFYSKNKKRFVISILYPVEEKSKNITDVIFNYENYPTLEIIFNLINEIEVDLYEDSILPLALAHKYAAISLNPGNDILEKFIKKSLS